MQRNEQRILWRKHRSETIQLGLLSSENVSQTGHSVITREQREVLHSHRVPYENAKRHWVSSSRYISGWPQLLRPDAFSAPDHSCAALNRSHRVYCHLPQNSERIKSFWGCIPWLWIHSIHQQMRSIPEAIKQYWNWTETYIRRSSVASMWFLIVRPRGCTYGPQSLILVHFQRWYYLPHFIEHPTCNRFQTCSLQC